MAVDRYNRRIHDLRLSLTGHCNLRLCLLHEKEIDLLRPMRASASDGELRRLIQQGI